MDRELMDRQADIEGKVKRLGDVKIRAQESLKNAKTRKKDLMKKIKEKTGTVSSKAFAKYVEDLGNQIEALMEECEAVLDQFEDNSFDDEEDDDDFDI